ncbi:Werner Syndrome-like exonuclease [Artemisia annua]|uniref:Werner Syndrome-like exonuclease n=1 Tax=Artemisia annua TaxID=35608 RepID=A0A2U1LSE4_ARTAN|nr:Werner Syndrome-like exonuclease [Artemisia annua]
MTSTTIVTIKSIERAIGTTITKDQNIFHIWLKKLENKNQNLDELNIGIDCKWDDDENTLSILQLCVNSNCLIFQLRRSEYVPFSLVELLNNPSYTFTGIGINKTCEELRFLMRNPTSQMVELGDLAVEKGYCTKENRGLGLVELAEIVLKKKVDEDYQDVGMRRWDEKDLSDNQIKCACIDGFLAFEIGRVLREQEN